MLKSPIASRIAAAAWLLIAGLRAHYATQTDSAFGGGWVREHAGLLLLQAFLALVVGVCLLAFPKARTNDDPAMRQAPWIFGITALVGFGAIFTTPDLGAFNYGN